MTETRGDRLRAPFLLATVFCSGAAVMILEMTAVRALQPFFGSTTYVWTNVIAVVLASLAAGYAIGGRLADRHPSPRLLYGLLGAGGVLLSIAAWKASAVSSLFLAEGVDLEGVVSVLVKGSLGATLILFAPPTLLLGMISPLAIRLLAGGGVGRAAGRVFALSTTGSILGTYLPAFVLVPFLGTRGSLFVAAGLLLIPAAAGLVVFAGVRGRGGIAAGLLLLAGGGVTVLADAAPGRPAPPLPNGGEARVLAETESEYQYLTVRDDRFPDGTVYRLLTINEGLYTYHSFRVEGRVLTESRYYDDYSVLPLLLDLPRGKELRACVVGLACGINAAQWKHFWDGPFLLRVDGAEIDPGIVRLGREFFDLPGPGSAWLRTFTMDGRQLLALLPPEVRYHVLVVDAFTNELYIPFHLGTSEFFRLCRDRLRPGGVLAMNVYASGESSPNLRALENTLASVFGRCLRIRQYGGANFLLLARKGDAAPDLSRLTAGGIRERWGDRPDVPEWSRLVRLASALPENAALVLPREDRRVLTDDHAPLEWLTDRFLRRTERGVVGR